MSVEVAKPIEIAEQAEKVKESEPVFTPAPVPTSSPWKSVSSDIPVTEITLDFSDNNRKRNVPAMKSSNATKWVPIKASIVISGSKSMNNGNNNHRRNATKSAKNRNNKSKNVTKKVQQQKDADVSDESKDGDNSNTNGVKSEKNDGKRLNNNNGNNFQKKKFYNRNGNQQRRQLNNNISRNDQFNRSSNTQNSLPPAFIAVNNVAAQVEYYFSEENLSKDTFLKSKMSKNGLVPLSLISQFYRVVNMSFGGDHNLILAAAREIVANENATVEIVTGKIESSEETESNLLSKYFVRSKNWSSHIPDESASDVEIEDVLVGDVMDAFRISFVPPTEDAPSN
ncbi:hypothetical protein Kpol_2000p101 [Vanderwaltozyma polyspora DSM 70294]|uniref:HTH La-type RNA-binding domain-containing protein n=1 Tax=Vanderwaltozyma polyspora (strain ATCC 22028 / DSM 70294 / BCRC 21397 / CBS 2163 / NBRC 10782 / NRRL Y-8283 / UCD 57-17) TaxID=436907 RepID=A7TFA8_VANPO|nr:uncharacterized protein Kpol_2000p101 [Vanderwaltozyma polyspora DSM 70294]EDO19133.1 hypothetical protein Kpol_2000p101 [Vanderwaltozyma polyspora DSM 70294]